MKRSVSFLMLLLISLSLFARKPLKKRKHNVNRALKEIAACSDFRTAGFGFLATDVNTGEVIAEYNPHMALRPASTLKLLTTATATELLTPQYRFITLLEYSGHLDTIRHILHGNLIIRGGGDPSLGSKYFEQTTQQLFDHWKDALKKQGIDSISGSVVADAGYFSYNIVPPSWSWQNIGNYYGAGPCGLTIEDNMYSVYFNTEVKMGEPAKIIDVSPTIPDLQIDNRVTADSVNQDNSVIYGAPYCNKRIIKGTLPVGRARFRVKGSMPDPAFIAAWQLDSALVAGGIKTAGKPTTVRLLKEAGIALNKRISFDTVFSPTLSEIIKQTNTHSINLFAEHCAIVAGKHLGAIPQTTVAMDSIKSFWAQKGMDTDGMRLTDGSGLSQYNAITADQMVFLLTYMKNKSRYFTDYYNSFAVGGQTGTLENMFYDTPAAGNIHAKSGTIDGVKAYAGYVTTKSGREVAFSMMVNNFSCSSHEAKAKLEYLMVALSEFKK